MGLSVIRPVATRPGRRSGRIGYRSVCELSVVTALRALRYWLSVTARHEGVSAKKLKVIHASNKLPL